MYLLFKVHKNPLRTRPVVSYCRNLLHPLGQLITECLQPLSKMQKSYFQDSFTLKNELELKDIPWNARLFICDATSMYTNIKTGPALHRIGKSALENKEHLTVPPAVLMDALRLLMTNNVFQFGDTLWLQKVGTAMGAPPAPPFGHNLLWYPRGDSARESCNKTLTLLLLHRRRPRHLAGRSWPSQRQPTMGVVRCFNARLLQAKVDL